MAWSAPSSMRPSAGPADSYAGNGIGTAYSPIGTHCARRTTLTGAVAGGTLGVYYAFIQFAGFTMGKAISQFSAPWTAYPGNSNFDGLVGGGGTVTGVNQFSYTAEFGNGISGTLSAQDPTAYYQAGYNNLGFGGWFRLPTTTAGTVAPDFVAMLRVDQAWGLFQASVAAHDNHAAYYSNAHWRAIWPSRRQVGLCWSVGLVDQEHPDRTR